MLNGRAQDGNRLDAKMQITAFRRVRVVEDPLEDAEGLTWLFEINNIRVFCGGMLFYGRCRANH